MENIDIWDFGQPVIGLGSRLQAPLYFVRSVVPMSGHFLVVLFRQICHVAKDAFKERCI
jgi:hypothetical protein